MDGYRVVPSPSFEICLFLIKDMTWIYYGSPASDGEKDNRAKNQCFFAVAHVYESRPDAEAGAGASPLLSEAGTRNAPLWDTLADVNCDLAQS